MKFRIHLVTSALFVGVVVLLTAALLFTAYSKFEQMAQENARIIFGQLVRANADRFGLSMAPVRNLVDVQSFIGYPAAIPEGSAEQQAYEERFSADLRQRPLMYSFYVGLQNGDFFQIIAVRGNEKIIKSLSAPDGTQSAIRLIHASTRQEYWRFYGAERQLLGERRAPSTYDPRSRPWYIASMAETEATLSDPYTFSSTGELGLTNARKLRNGHGVVGADVTLTTVQQSLTASASTPHAVVALIDAKARLVVTGLGKEAVPAGDLKALTPLAQTNNLMLASFATESSTSAPVTIARFSNEDYVLAAANIGQSRQMPLRMVAFAPMSDLSSHVVEARNQMLLIALLILLASVPAVIWGSRQVTQALRELGKGAARIRELDFSATPEVASVFVEIDSLSKSQTVMKTSLAESSESLKASQSKLENLIRTGLDLSRERDRLALLKTVLFGGKDLTHSDGGTLYLLTEQKTLMFAMRTRNDPLPSFQIPLYKPDGQPNDSYISTFVALHNETVVVDDIYTETRFDVSGTRKFDAESGHRTVSMLTLPLSPREGEVIGVIQFMNAQDPATGAIIPFSPEVVRFVTALAAQAAVALDNHQLVEAQLVLMDSLIKLIAGAVDAKSPYTGGHCERVPELAIMLAAQAELQTDGPFADFRWADDDARREFRVGAWLHDCGKVTTPEYVVDKSTKLETIYDRIHEVHTRFEVLLRDARIAYWQARVDGQDEVSALEALTAREAQLEQDFVFIAQTNEGGEFMAPERLERLRQIGEQTWSRHFDDRIGVSHESLRRLGGVPVQPLPATEHLLSDRPEHIFPRGVEKSQDERHGFKVKVPENLYNQGELYNLSIARGTLTEEERYKINEHVIQTILMLEALPFPKNMRRVPEYAGTHHETLIGTGYPRKLTAEQLSVPSRIMVLADVFEALTASDRPYKKPKTLSECVKIMSFLKKDKHVDPDLFDLFLTSGVYKTYAERYLKPEQLDEVNIAQYVSASVP